MFSNIWMRVYVQYLPLWWEGFLFSYNWLKNIVTYRYLVVYLELSTFLVK